jgi:D-alanyl-D-alanine carboxypeptidase
VAVLVVAACGSNVPTSAPPSSSAPRAALGSAGPAAIGSLPPATPNPSIVPVPTSHLVAASPLPYHLDAGNAKALQAALDAFLKSDQYPGVSAAIVFPDGTMWTGVSGSAVLSPATPVTTDTLFSIGSVSKTFVAALIGRLSQDGKIGLDDHLAKYLPDFPNAANITIRELLNHTSGIKDLFDANDPAIGDMDAEIANHRDATWTADQVLAAVGASTYFEPGTGYHYSNTNYLLLGLVAEKATGQKVADLVRSMFLTPLGLDHTYLQTEEKPAGPEAHGYCPDARPTCSTSFGAGSAPVDDFAGTMLPYTAEATAVGFAGAYVSTASDLAVWASALYGGAVLDQATLASMVDISPSLPYKKSPPYGMGFEETTIAGHVAWGHRGLLDGFWTAVEYLRDFHVAIVVEVNANWAAPLDACSALAKIAVG